MSKAIEVRKLQEVMDYLSNAKSRLERLENSSQFPPSLYEDISGLQRTFAVLIRGKNENEMVVIEDDTVDSINQIIDNTEILLSEDSERSSDLAFVHDDLLEVSNIIGSGTNVEFSDLKEEMEQMDAKVTSIINDWKNRKHNSESKLRKLEEKQEEIEEILDEFNIAKEEIRNSRQELQNLKDEASDIIRDSVSGSLSSEFDKRKQELEDTLRYWRIASIISIILLIIFSIYVYQDISASDSNWSVTMSKALLLLPSSVFIWFCTSNYTQQKKLMHEYEFKKNIAVSLPGFRERLEQHLSEDNEEKIAEIMIQTMDKIYSNPQKNISNGDGDGNTNGPSDNSGGATEILRLLRK